MPALESITLAPAHAAPLTVTGVCACAVVAQATKPSIELMQSFLNRERFMNFSLTGKRNLVVPYLGAPFNDYILSGILVPLDS